MSETLLTAAGILSMMFFYKSSGQHKTVFLTLLFWIGFQSVLAIKGFYLDTMSLPPRPALMIAPPLLLLFALLSLRNGRAFLRSLDLKMLTWLHVVRVPVEVMLWLLYIDHLLPIDLTFEGANWDIVMGLTAPMMVYLYFQKKQINRHVLLGWNIISIFLLGNVVVRGILSVESPFQQFGFEQPNVAMLHFPFNFLPALIVPLVLYANIAAIMQLTSKK